MIRFKVFLDGRPPAELGLAGAYLVGGDGVPLRGELTYSDGELRCTKRAPGPAALVLLWPVGGFGRIMLETTRLMEREQPYHLNVELARGRLMRISQKREDWGLYDFSDGAEFYRRIDEARGKLVDAVTASDGAAAARHADEALAESVAVGEELGLFHADLILKRRRNSGGVPKRPFGMTAALGRADEPYREKLLFCADFVTLPVTWRDVEPRKDALRWDPIDLWINWLGKNRLHVRCGPLVALEKSAIPDWALRLEHSYERMRDQIVANAARLVQRFTHRVQSWEVVSGLHAHNPFHFSFEQLMDLTRTAAMVVKQNAPRSTSLITVSVPWGEYYAHDVRSIPPLLYADMCVQSGFHFDAFGLQIMLGAPVEGMLARDMMQVSSLLDRFGALGKTIHVSAALVPSTPLAGKATDPALQGGGIWHAPWSEQVQARWVRAFYDIAFSKPFVESVNWGQLVDGAGGPLATGGLLHGDLTSKPAHAQLLEFRQMLLSGRPAARRA